MRSSSRPPLPLLFLLSLLTSTAFCTPAPAETLSAAPPHGGFHLPLHHHNRRADPEGVRSWALREKGRMQGKYGPEGEVRRERRAETALSTAGVGAATATATGTATAAAASSANTTLPGNMVGLVQVSNFEADLEYFAQVGVGVPPQYMNVILDTGSADLWIASSACTDLTGCTDIPTLNVSASTSAFDTESAFSVRYGSGSASGDVWQDFVSLGGYNVSSQGYALVDTVSTGLLSGNISGLLGLGFQTLAASGVTPFWQNLFQAGVLPFPGFAFYLTRFSNISTAASVEPGGSLTLGYLNESLYEGEINYVPIPERQESYWLIPLEGVRVNGTNVTEGRGNVAIDTGTTLIGGPAAVIRSLYAMIPGAAPATGDYVGYYSYPCESKVNISMAYGGVFYNMTSDDFNLGAFGSTNNVSTCLGAFFDLSLSSTSRISWVIGAAFLKNVYSVYRASPPSVGFALLSNGTSSHNTTRGYGNLTGLPGGIFGPEGVFETQVPANTVTTAIEAGQTVSRTDVSGAVRVVGGWVALLGVGVGLLWA